MDSGFDDSPDGIERLTKFFGSEDGSSSILAIDDDSTTLELLEDLLSMSGFSVYTAGEGREGIELFSRRRPDLVISDIQMPHMDGLELLKRVGEVDDAVPVILVTGHGDLENALRALRQGAYDFLLKPINPEILMATVRKGLERCRLRRFEKNYRRLLEEQVEERTKELAERTRELARTNEFLQGILDSSTRVAIFLTDFDNRVLFWNSGAENIYGYKPEEMVGSSILQLFPVDEVTVETVDKLGSLVRIRAGTVQENVKQVAKDGRNLTVSLAVSPMKDASGQLRGILGLGQDVTKEVSLHEELLKSYKRIKKIQGASIFALAKLAESRDGETAYHLERMQEYCLALCLRLRCRTRYRELMTDQFIEDLVQCSVLHDIGKVAIPDSILFNTDKFGIDEYEIMKQHAIHGGRALEEAAEKAGERESFLTVGKDVAYYHHERWDGKGYPFRLSGEEIPLAARIVAIA
ncbi:MAG: response regulator, partial [Deltaproteobacteria bacterium]|nr:response regulator [Deltaproteobacteria bacterium]